MAPGTIDGCRAVGRAAAVASLPKLALVGLVALAALTCSTARAEGDRSPRPPAVGRRAPVQVEPVEAAIETPAAIAALPAPAPAPAG